MCFGQNQTTSGTQNSQQSGTSQSNLFNNGQFQTGMGNFFSQFDPSNIATAAAQNPTLNSAVSWLASNIGGPIANIASNGLDTNRIQAFLDPYTQSVVDATRRVQGLTTAQGVSGLRGAMGTRGSLGNNVGTEAAYRVGRDATNDAQIAALYSQGYTGAREAALADQNARIAAGAQGVQGAAALGNLGQTLQQNQLIPFLLQSQFSQNLAPFLQAAGVNFSGLSSGTTTGKSSTSPGIGNVIAGLIGAGLQGLSDPRAKENRREIGVTKDGQKLYAFNYRPGLGLPMDTRIGLDAFEVARRDPGAVAETPLGLAVNYDRALARSTTDRSDMRDGGDIMEKVARAFNLVRGLRRSAMADGGAAERPGYFLGGLTDTLFGTTTGLGGSAGGWDTSVVTPGLLSDVNWTGLGRGLSNMGGGGQSQNASGAAAPKTPTERLGAGLTGLSTAMGGLGGDPRAAAEAARAGENALARQQAELGAMLQSLVARPREDGGRVGYDDGGDIPESMESPAFIGYFPGTGDRVVAPRLAFPGSGMGTVSPEVSPARPFYSAGLLPPTEEAPAVEATPPAAAAPAARSADLSGPVVVERAGADAPVTWYNDPNGIFASFHGGGYYHGKPQTPWQRLGTGLMAASGPMVFGPWAQTILEQQGVDIKDRDLQRQADLLRHNMEHQAAVLRETMRHNRVVEDPPEVREIEAMGIPRGTPEFRAAVAELRRRKTPEDAFQTAQAKAAADQATALGAAIDASRTRVANLNNLEALLSRPGVPQGFGAEWELSGKRLATALGFKVEGVAEAEAATAITNQLALAARDTANGQGMPGAMSDADRVFLVNINAGIHRTPAGNKLMIQIGRDIAQYQMRANMEAQRFINANRTNAGLQEHMTQWMAANPMPAVIPGHEQRREALRAEDAIATAAQNPQPGAPPLAAVNELRAARGSAEEARRIQQFNQTFNGGRPGMAEEIMAGRMPAAAPAPPASAAPARAPAGIPSMILPWLLRPGAPG
jgi:hypothetical protein